jgi:dephospho-CoA kinase
MLRIGVTGGIGSGKTTVAQAFASRGVPVIDTDQISRSLTSAHGLALPELRKAFGDSVFGANGSLDRKRLRSLILNDSKAKRQLESILHPIIQRETFQQLERLSAPYALVVIPLLVETGVYDKMLDRVLVVDCSEEIQVQRALARGGWEEAEIRATLAAQAPRQARLEKADDVINNDGNLDALSAQVALLDEKYRALTDQRL